MLSAASVSAGQAASYYSKDNYYSQDEGIEQSAWWGKGAQSLGLSGQVKPEEFENLLDGNSPDGSTVLVNKSSLANSHKARAGTDLTFSAPKSVTLTAFNDPRIIDAHKAAVEEALKAVEQDFAYVRLGAKKEVKPQGNLTVAIFHHDTSRTAEMAKHPDPQLHSHCVALNMVETDDGKNGTRRLSHYNDGIFNNSKLIGMIYQNALAKQVMSLGYNIEQNANGTFEIAGYSREQIEEFSKRRMEIVALNATTKKQERVNVLATRQAKTTEISSDDLREAWIAEIKEAGITFPQPGPCKSPVFNPEVGEKAIESAVRHFSERDVSFSEKKALTFTYEKHIGELPSYTELKRTLADHEWTLQHGTNYYGDKQYTTALAIFRERETIRIMKEGQGRFPAIASKEEADRVIEGKSEDYKFTQGQEDAFRQVVTSCDQVLGWQGVAGAGKSHALRDFRKISEAKGYTIIGMAPDAAAAKVLGASAGLSDSMTVDSFLLRPSKPAQSKKPEIWVVDEAGKMSARKMHSLIEKAQQENARMVLVGDTRQLPAVEAGNPFKLLQENGMSTAHLTEHRRQRSVKLKKAVDLLGDGKIAEGLKALRTEVTELPRQSSRVKKAARLYMEMDKRDREKTLILAGTNAERVEILEAIRGKLKASGELGQATKIECLRSKSMTKEESRYAGLYEVGDIIVSEQSLGHKGIERLEQYEVTAKQGYMLSLKDTRGKTVTIDPSILKQKNVYVKENVEIAVGDLLKWTKNQSALDRRNGENIRVSAIEGNSITLKNSKGVETIVDGRNMQYLDHARVSTIYGSQGKTANHVIMVGDNSIGKESLYVAISRARYSVSILVDSYDQMVKKAQRSQSKRTALELFAKKDPKPEHLSPPVPSQTPHLMHITSELNQGKAHSALLQLKPFIKEVGEKNECFARVAKKYASLPESEREKTAVFAPDREDAQKLRSLIRRQLHANGELKNLEKVTLLESKAALKGQSITIEAGDTLVPSIGSSSTRVRKGKPYKVIGVDGESLHLESPSGKPLQIKESDFRGRVLRERKNSLAEGDSVLWVDPKGKPVRGKVSEIYDGRVEAAFDDGRSQSFRLDKPIPLEHAIVEYSARNIGEGKDHIIIACDHKISSKVLETAVSKASTSVEIYTDDVKKMDGRFAWYEEESLKKQDPAKAKIKEFDRNMEQFRSGLGRTEQVARQKETQANLEL